MGDLRVSFPRPCDESWDAMTPAGRARMCARCDKAVHDLSHYEMAEAEALLRREPEACVRASVGADGMVALKRGQSGARRMAIAAAVSAGLLAGGTPALAKTERPQGVIAGKVDVYGLPVRVVATDAAGKTFRTKTGRKGRYKLKHLPPGTYGLRFEPGCGEVWTVENVVVGHGPTLLPDAPNSGCIIIGRIRIEDGGDDALA